MSNAPYQQIAKEFMDLWQKQVSSIITDKQFIQSMLEMFQSMQMPDYDRKPGSSTASDPAHAADAGHELLAEFAYRLSMCEKRLAVLEQGEKKSRPSKPASPKKTGAGRVGKGHPRGSKKPR